MPTDILMMINERVTVSRSGDSIVLTVVPISFQEYDRLMSKPYARPLKRQAWRIFNYSSSVNKADLIVGPDDSIREYTFRYVKRPAPIILTNLDGGLTIGNEHEKSDCELDPILHHEILKRAVELAKAAYEGSLQSTLAMGQVSQTDIGQIQSR